MALEFSRRDTSKVGTLDILGLFVMQAAADQYFDWFAMQEICEQIWEEITPVVVDNSSINAVAVVDKESTTMDVVFFAALNIILEARDLEEHAKKMKVDVSAFVREHSAGLVAARRIIQSHIGVDKFDRSRGAGTDGRVRMSWFRGDQQLMESCAMTVEDAPYPSAQVLDYEKKLYKNWSSEILQESAVLIHAARGRQKASEPIPRRPPRFVGTEEWVNLLGDLWSQVGKGSVSSPSELDELCESLD